MAGGGGKHVLVSRLLIVSAFATLQAHPVPTQLNGMKYINNKIDAQIKTYRQGHSDIGTLLNDPTNGSLHRRILSEEGGLSGTSGTGIVPEDATKIMLNFPFNHNYRSDEGRLGGNGATEIESYPTFGSRGQLKVHHSKRFGEEGLGGNTGDGIEADQMEGRSEEGGLGGSGGTGIEPSPPFGSKGQLKVHRMRRWGDEGLGGNTGDGIEADQMEGRSEEGGLGGSGGTVIEPFPHFGSKAQLKVHRMRRWGDEGLGGNNGDGIEADQMEGRSEEGGLGGSGGTGREPSPPFGSKGQLKDHHSK